MSLRREICERFIREPGYRFVELPDPKRSKEPPTLPPTAGSSPTGTPPALELWAQALSRRAGRRRCRRVPGVGRSVVVRQHVAHPRTGRRSRRSSTYDVIPGITAIQALTARHRIPLNELGAPVLITTGRRLREGGALRHSRVVMLDGDCAFLDCPPATEIWWGAYLGTPTSSWWPARSLRSGSGSRSAPRPATRHGWIMDTYLLRAGRRRPWQDRRVVQFLFRAAVTGSPCGSSPSRLGNRLRRR